jgi:hydroxymethylbilane synthase
MTHDPAVIGTRGSQLAVIQAETVLGKLRAAFPGRRFEMKKIVTGGDRNQTTRLDRMDTIGVFVKELEEALFAGDIDIAVHSLKDVPTIMPEGAKLAAALERQDPRDVLVTRGETLDHLARGARVGTGSLRRQLQLRALRPDLVTGGIRGNVDTRLRKVENGEYDGVMLAAAALHRMNLEGRITQFMPAGFLPAVGQGIVALEIRSDDDDAAKLAEGINHGPTWRCALAERAFLYELGGGCAAPIAALATLEGEALHLEGLAASPDGARVVRGKRTGTATEAEATGIALARDLLAQGAAEFIEEATR